MSPSRHARHWDLDPTVLHLNHGSFGAAPRAVMNAQEELRRRIEANPVRFFSRDAPGLLDHARERLAGFIGADPSHLAFVANATTGANAVLRSRRFAPGDEIVVTELGYGGVAGAVSWVADRTGASVQTVRVGLPIRDPDSVSARVLDRLGPRTRLVVVDHITSATGAVMPIADIAAGARRVGVPLLVDGAHAPGQVALDVEAIGADWYTANCHKWLSAPKGAAFLWVRNPDSELVPAVVGWGRSAPPVGRSQFHADFDWVGTDDPTPYLCVPTAIDTLGAILPGGWPALRRRNRVLTLAARRLLLDTVGASPPVPDGMVGTMAAIPLPPGDRPAEPLAPDPLQMELTDRGVEVPVTHGPANRRWLRISAHAYNGFDDYAALAGLLERIGHG